MELEENVRRKDLTEYEKNKAMVEYVEAVKEELENEAPQLISESDKNPKGGRSSNPSSQQKLSERTGIPQSSISEAQSHVGTAAAFPFMQSWPQYRVLEASLGLRTGYEEVIWLKRHPGPC